MIEHRPFVALGRANHGWLDARYHFSFSSYYDFRRMGWGALRVLNDDEIAGGHGFPAHPHRDMEIVTYVREGAITHEDNLGNKGRTGAGEVQVMTAGTGVWHSEANAEDETTRLFQLWILPREQGVPPAWGTKALPHGSDGFVTLASGFPEDDGALAINADARVLGATLLAGTEVLRPLELARHAYLVVARGAVAIGDLRLGPRDAVAITDEPDLRLRVLDDCELLLVDTL